MSSDDAVDAAKAQQWKKRFKTPQQDQTTAYVDNVKKRPGRPSKTEPITQLNLRVPERVKRRLRILAANHDREMSDIVVEAIALFEEKYGEMHGLANEEER